MRKRIIRTELNQKPQNAFFIIHFSFYILISLSLLLGPAQSQTVYEPLHRDIYPFLERLSHKGIIDYNDLITPLPRKYLAEKLLAADRQRGHLTTLEQQELDFLKQDFFNEILRLQDQPHQRQHRIAGKDPGGRWRLFSYSDSLFQINLSPIYGMQFGQNDGASQSWRWNGAYIHGAIGNHLGFSFDFRDNREEGDNIDLDKGFTPVTGVDAMFYEKSHAIEYSEIRTTIAADWPWGRVTLGKDFIRWGHAQNGRVVHSSKAPSYPFIRLDIQPVNWLSFNYFHGWLESDIIDSTSLFPTLDGRNSFQFRDKYIASHTLTLKPFRTLQFSIGESIVYSDRLEFAYLNPLMFFRLADHYLSDRNNAAGGNAQLFFNAISRNKIPNTEVFTTLFIDDLSVAQIFNAAEQRNHVSATLGISVSDPLIDNLTLSLEYTRNNPFVYQHFIPSMFYESSSYPLGHWAGHNSDLIYGSLNYRFRRGFELQLSAQRIRKGGQGETRDQYTFPHKPFLFDPVSTFNQFSGEIRYEWMHELEFRLGFTAEDASVAAEDNRDLARPGNRFYFGINYGR